MLSGPSENRGRRAAAALVPMAVALTLAACGGSGASSHPTSGKAIFESSGCAGCHTLAAAGATGSSGPDLDKLRPSYRRVVAQVRSGGVIMPSFAGKLSASQIRSVARFVASATR